MSVLTAHNWRWPAHRAAHAAPRDLRPSHAVVAGLALERHERVLTAARDHNGERAVATDRALLLVGAHGRHRRVPWMDIAEVTWQPASRRLIVALWPESAGQPPALAVRVDRAFASFAAERVAAAQVLCRHVQLTETVAALVLATRTPGADEVRWRVLFDAGGDDDPAIVVAAQRALAEVRALAGC